MTKLSVESPIGGAVAQAVAAAEGGNLDDGVELLRAAREYPGTTEERYALGVALLRLTNGQEGWDLYDLHPSLPNDQASGVASWAGEECDHLLLVAEQGFGDAIQFLRFAPAALHRADRVTLAVHDELLEAVRTSPLLSAIDVISKSTMAATDPAIFNFAQRLMSMPQRIAGGPVAEPLDSYLTAPPLSTAQGDFHRDGSPMIGVCWRSTQRSGFPDRSIPAHLLSSLSSVAVVTSIQHSSANADAPDGVLLPSISNFVDTAAVISQCDAVVTCDTVTAHLAPSLGVPTYLCLLHRPDWRWGTRTHPTAWYRSHRMFFQPSPGKWEGVVDAAAEQIKSQLPSDGTAKTRAMNSQPVLAPPHD